jgi:fucose permease
MIGILLGPMYPIALNHTAVIIPRHLVSGTLGWISACGAGGSALLPFLTGTMASKLGIESLQPLCVFHKIFLRVLYSHTFFLAVF